MEKVKQVKEGEKLPETVIKTSGTLVTLHKRGRLLSSSYEALRFHKLDLFTVMLRQIGAYIARQQMNDAADLLLEGDGSEGSEGITMKSLTAAPTYDDLVALWGSLSPYSLTTLLVGTDALQALLKLTEFKDAQAGQSFHGTGRLITPLGATLVHVPEMNGTTIIGLDKSCTLEMVQAGEVVTDYDKLIDRQMERAGISAITGFAQLVADSAKGITYTVGS